MNQPKFFNTRQDENLVEAYLDSRGLEVERFSKIRMRSSKTPDFRVLKKRMLVGFCEVKTIAEDEWLSKKLEVARSNIFVGGIRRDPIPNRLTDDVHTSVKQFDAVNPSFEFLNILAFVNRDPACRFEDLVSVLTGYWDPGQGIYDKTHSQYSEGRIMNEKRRVDVYLWFGSIQYFSHFRFQP